MYAEILHIKNEFTGIVKGDTGPQFGFCRIPGSLTNFMKQFYEEASVPPQSIEYVEAFGSGKLSIVYKAVSCPSDITQPQKIFRRLCLLAGVEVHNERIFQKSINFW